MNTITLTFDNGPDPVVTPQVLDILSRHRIQTTFFVLGDKLRDRRAVAARAYSEGHWVGNHTFNHIVPLGLASEAFFSESEILRTAELIGDLAHARNFFRPFGGGGNLDGRLLNTEALDVLATQKFTCVLWNAVPQDWAYPRTWVERAIQICRQQDETLMVLHDLPTGAMDRLDRFICQAKDEGFTFKQEFPAACVPIERGVIQYPIDGIVTTNSTINSNG